jgi:hypothetical protein
MALRRLSIVCLIIATTLLARPLSATTLFTTGAPSSTLGVGAFVDGWVAAERFIFSTPAAIDQVIFYSFEDPGMWDGTLDYFFFTQSAGGPASFAFAQGHNPVFTKTQLGVSFGAVEYRYIFHIAPLPLAAGTYFLGIHMKSDFNLVSGILEWDSRAVNPNGGPGWASSNGTFDNWTTGPGVLAFELDSTAPEPATGILLVMGALCLAFRRSLT